MLPSTKFHTALGIACLAYGTGGLASSSSGCGKSSTLDTQIYSATINGKERQYYVRLPEDYDKDRPYRLIFTYHQFGSSMQSIVAGEDLDAPLGGALPFFGLPPLANETAIFIVPDGLDRRWANTGGEDIEFFDHMVSTVGDALCVDENLRFSTGFSFGGAISFAIACARPDVIRAIAVLSGAQLSGCDADEEKPLQVPYYGQHGTADTMLPIASGRELRDRFVELNGCTPVSPEPEPNGDRSVVTHYEGCKEGYPVTWVVHIGGHSPSVKDGGSDIPFAPQNSWDFFAQFT